MTDTMKFDLSSASRVPDPTTDSGEIFMFEEALGQNGRPFVFMVEDPPNKTRARHYHHGDVLHVYTKGEHHIEGEGIYRAGDLRWTRAGHAYGPETTGPNGGAWWVISYSDPIPVDVTDNTIVAVEVPIPEPGCLPTFEAPYDWSAIDEAVRSTGGAIILGLLDPRTLTAVNADIDEYLGCHVHAGAAASSSHLYDMFLGHNTIRLHGLIDKVPSTAALIGHHALVSWAERLLGDVAESVLLNAGELIQIQPGEPAQFPHRDSDSWPEIAVGDRPVIVNAIVALDDCTLDNGATHIATGSWGWERGRQPTAKEWSRAVMSAGDAVLFRGDIIHGGGENGSDAGRRVLSISYCAGWLRPVENSFLTIPRNVAAAASPVIQGLLGYRAHDATDKSGGIVGLYENGDPALALAKPTDLPTDHA